MHGTECTKEQSRAYKITINKIKMCNTSSKILKKIQNENMIKLS